jgi:dUTP pyrophosphatase
MECLECNDKFYCSESCAFKLLKNQGKYNSLKKNIIKLKITSHEPIYQTIQSSCVDLSCVGNYNLKKNTINTISTGVYLEYLDYNYDLQILSRSGMAQKGLIVLNSPGVIDSDYKNEIFVLLFNVGKTTTINDGDRIAQMKISKTYKIPDLKILKNNIHNGFGSTGVNNSLHLNKKRNHEDDEDKKNKRISTNDIENDIKSM